MPDNPAYRYFAFISYSSKDKKVAEKIHSKIETYRLPTVLRNELEAANKKKYPKRVRPLFRDMTDLNAGLLGKSILRELEDSRFLLVICSPESAQSEWVNQEVENFILMDRYDRIIPYIIDGVPNSGDPATECFPPILRKNREFINYSHLSPEENAERRAKLHAILDPVKDELKGVSLSGEGPRRSRLKVIAKMLDVTPDTLIQRDKQRQRKRTLWTSIAVMFFMILMISLGLWTWDRYYRVHVGYFADYVEYWGVPRGIFPLTADQREHRESHYRIYTQNRKVIRLEHVNSQGTLVPVNNTEFQDRPMVAVYPIYKNGRLVQRDTLDRNGRVVMSYHYSGDKMQKVEFKSLASDDTASSAVLSNVTSLTSSLLDSSQEGKRGEIGNMRLERDSEGRVIVERFQKGSYDIPTTDDQGIAGFQYKLDEYGRVIEKIYLGPDGSPRPDKQGVARRTNRYDRQGNLIEIKYFDQNDRLIPNELGWMHSIQTFDNYGNLIEKNYLDFSGKLALSNALIAGVACIYDKRGELTEASYFGVDEQPCLCRNGFAKFARKYNERGDVIEEAYFGVDGQPCLDRNDIARRTWKYDESGKLLESSYFGVDGKPCLCADGYARFTWKYDERGNIIEQAYFGVDNQPCLHRDGNAKVTWRYDERGNQTEVACFGKDNKPCMISESFSKLKRIFDERGNETEAAYFGVDGKPCLCENGFASAIWKYDERGNVIEKAFFDVDGKPCLYRKGSYARITRKRDDRGNVIEEEYFDVDGKPCRCKDGYSKASFEFNENGKVSEAEYFDINGQEYLSRNTFANNSMPSDEREKMISEAYPGIADSIRQAKAMSRRDENGIAFAHESTDEYKVVVKYDDHGNVTEIAYLDSDDELCKGEEGCARMTKKYDQRGNLIEEAYFDAVGRLCLCEMGIPKTTWKYDERGNKIEEAYFDTDGQPCSDIHKITWEYDDRGNMIEEAYFCKENQPCMCEAGYTKITWKYDENGKILEKTFYDAQGQPLPSEGSPTEETEQNEPQTSRPEIRNSEPPKEESEQGARTEIIYLDEDRIPCDVKDAVMTMTVEYDEHGNKTGEMYDDDVIIGLVDGSILEMKGRGFIGAYLNIKYPETLDTSEEDEIPNGSEVPKRNDLIAKNEETAIPDMYNAKPAYKMDEDGIGYARPVTKESKAVIKYDKSGNITEIAFFDINGAPCFSFFNCAKITKKYDEHGNLIEEAHFTPDGQLCLCDSIASVPEVAWKYDDRGNKIEEAYFDMDGQPCPGIRKTVWKYNEQGKAIEEAYFGRNDRPYRLNGVAKVTWKYDERGNKIEEAYFDANGQPCLCDIYPYNLWMDFYADKVAKITWKYDERGNITEESYFGIDGQTIPSENSPTEDTKQNETQPSQPEISKSEQLKGGNVPFNLFGLDAKPQFKFDGLIAHDLVHSTPCHWETFYFDSDNKPCEEKNAVVKMTVEYVRYDEHLSPIHTYFELANKPILICSGFVKLSVQCDEQKNIIEAAFLDTDGNPCLCDHGYAKITWKYDEHGNQTEEAYFGIDGNPCLCKDRYAKITWKYDEQGNQTEEVYFNTDGNPCRCKDGYAKITWKYDEHGNQTEEAYFGIDGRLEWKSKTFNPWHRRYIFSYAKFTKKYDEGGNVIEEAYFGRHGELCRNRITRQYDEQGNQIEEAYFNADGTPCLCKDGYAKITWKYDEQGKRIEETRYGVDGQPLQSEKSPTEDTKQNETQPSQPENSNTDSLKKETELSYLMGLPIPQYLLDDDHIAHIRAFNDTFLEVLPASNSEKFGLKEGDLIILYDGQPVKVNDEREFSDKRSKETGNDPHELVVLRDNEFVVIQIYPGKLGCRLGLRAPSEDQQKLILEILKEVKKK